MMRCFWLCVSAAVLAARVIWAAPPPALDFEVLLPVEAAAEAGIEASVSGRLYVFLSRQARREPRFGPDWFAPEPFFGMDVRDWQPGTTRTLGPEADGFPAPLHQLPAGEYYVQAILDHDFYNQHHARGVNNLYSEVRHCMLDPQSPQSVALVVDRRVRAEPFPENEHVKEVVLRSELLSQFHGREVVERAAVVLPSSYWQRPEARYPVVYLIPGFGGSHRDALVYARGAPPAGEGEVEFIRVMLSGQCKWGHHVYADSATNGPRGRALIEELIPYIDRTYRTVAQPTARFVSGHSSGGWSSLWLQVTYPDTFGGVWSTSPDPVDFRDYQQVDLYANPPLSLYYDEQGGRRPIARRGTQPVLWYDAFGKMDDVLGRGGQLRSFEAVFSPLDDQGLPRKLWDRQTGRIDPEVARAWQAYDLRLVIERNWQTLGPKLAGKLHIVTGSLDTFYLEGAVIKLSESLRALGSDAQIEIVPDKDHGSVLTPELVRRMRREMSQAYLKHHAP
ncbi:MAG: hypothetical protein K6T86_01290 [Pirellulales bacterium]|nr:hypothetical protein [Pirellulales bacterium]